ncbi:PorV/PorQ family protein [candidate division KSB1 bacterium]|nr:PorV/PorQ family protein [candidate division KSB1 bacterium]
MKYKINPILIASMVFLLLFGTTLFAGNSDKVGQTAAPELLIPIGGRDLAMGGSSIAISHGIESIFWNPAGLAHAERNATAMFSRLTYIGDIDVNYVAVAGTFGDFGTVGLSIKSMDFGDIPITTEDFPDGTGAFLDPTFFTIGVTYSKLLSDRVSVGFTGNFISEDLAEARVSATGFAFSAGVQYQNLGGIQGLDLGVAVKNIGPQMGFDGSGLLREGSVDDVSRGGSFVKIDPATEELPSTIEIGGAYSFNAGELSSVRITGMFQNNNFSDDQGKFGAEYEYNNLFFVRGGYDFAPGAADEAFIFGASFGAGVRVDVGGVEVFADYGFRESDFFDNQNAFSVRLGF